MPTEPVRSDDRNLLELIREERELCDRLELIRREKIQQVNESTNTKGGGLLSVIPGREDWNKFLNSVQYWYSDKDRYPCHLLILYDGLAFYEYDASSFWPQFAKAVGREQLPANQQSEINKAFARAAQTCGLPILRRPDSIDYVGSAVHHIGVPLSLWDDFLEICEWMLSQDSWVGWSDEEWSEVVTKRVGGRTRLKNFLLSNRETSSDFIQEMHNARKRLSEDESLTSNDVQQASLLRQEYFDEVPETAEFLRPTDPESLLRDRAQLVWDEEQACIRLQLPAVSHDKLPAKWKIGTLTLKASATPDTLSLNSEAFTFSLVLELQSGHQSESQWLPGIAPWGIFDLEHKRFVNPKRQRFPIHSYMLVSPDPLEGISRKGFEEEDNPTNECYELEDGTTCYVTRLWPVGKHAELSITHAGKTKKLSFRPRFKIEARIFAGKREYAANFWRYREDIKLERLPVLCIAIPPGSFQDTGDALREKFRVTAGEQLVEGIWDKRHEDDSQEFYFWRWEDELQLRKKVNVSVKSPELGIEFKYRIEMLRPKKGLDECWRHLPGAFLPWVLLAQPAVGANEGMRWNDLLLAKEAIAPEQRLSAYVLRKYARYGLLEQRGARWLIAESRAVFEPVVDGECNLRFCGNPAVLWRLFRHMYDYAPGLPVIEVIDKRGELPFLLMRWKEEQQARIVKYLNQYEVRIVSDLWNE